MIETEMYAERRTPNLKLHIGDRHWKLRTKYSYSPLDKWLLSLLVIPDDLGASRLGCETFFVPSGTALAHW
jgi:DNA-directed RNA polymerase delta subunit